MFKLTPLGSQYAVLTQSPVIHNGVAHQGVSSPESELGLNPDVECCSFRGSANAIDAKSSKVPWRHYRVRQRRADQWSQRWRGLGCPGHRPRYQNGLLHHRSERQRVAERARLPGSGNEPHE